MKTLGKLVLWTLVASVTVIMVHSPWSHSAGQPSLLDKLRWGVLLQTERPFYTAGDTAKAIYGIFNFSAEDAYGWSNVGGGNGCRYTFTVEDDQGQVVWEPYDIICTAAIVHRDLPSASRIHEAILIPLIYDNNNGVGTVGDPLPAGFYKVCVTVRFNGPHRSRDTIEPGLDYSASVPIQIE